jgi:hypothetical protein
MTELIGGVLVTGAGAAACGVAVGRMLFRYRHAASESAAEASAAGLDRYAVLARLTTEEDLIFLRKLPGYRAEMAARLRRERRAILRMYLRELAGDFHSLHQAARRLAAEAPQEHAGLVSLLFSQQVTFWRRLAAIEVRLTLAPLGVGRVDASRLLETVEALRAAVAQSTAMAPVPLY